MGDATIGAVGQKINGRYHLLEHLASGGMASVFLARDGVSGQRVCLKTVARDSSLSGDLEMLVHEFRTLKTLKHPNVEEVYDFGVIEDGSGHFFSCEYIEGEDLFEATRESGFDEIADFLVQICRGLNYIHSLGLVHFDVKPENILVRSAPGGGRGVKLIDFGLAGGSRTRFGTLVMGTPAYIAPEIVRGDPVDHRADLYSLGVTLHRVLGRGQPGLTGTTPDHVLERLMSAPQAPVSPLGDIPPELVRVTLRLLEKSPDKRFRNANEIIESLGRARGRPIAVETPETQEGRILSGRFVGRRDALRSLKDLLAAEGEGDAPAMVLLLGEGGIGKTRLMREFRVHAQVSGWRFFWGEGREEGGESWRHWRDILSEIVLSLGKDDRIVRTFAGALALVLPDVVGDAKALPELEGPQGKVRLLDSLARFVIEASGRWPLVVCLDDIQWADVGSLDLLGYLVRHLRAAVLSGGGLPPVRVLAAQRVGEGEDPERRLFPADDGEVRRLRLAELDRRDVASLLESMYGEGAVPTPFVDKVMEASRGHPLFVEETLRFLAARGALVWTGARWSFPEDALEKVEIPGNIRKVMAGMVEGLKPKELAVLEAVAVFGGPVTVATLKALEPGADGEEIAAALGDLLARALVERSGSPRGWSWRIRHGLLARFLGGRMAKAKKAALHARAGAILDEGAGDVERLERAAHHFLQARDGTRGVPRALDASSRLSSAYQFERALRLLEPAADLAGDDWATKAGIHRAIGRNHIYSGNLSAGMGAFEACREALERSGGDWRKQASELFLEGGRTLHSLGRDAEAVKILEKSEGLAAEIGDDRAVARARLMRGACIVLDGKFDEAEVLFDSALGAFPSLRDGEFGALVELSRAFMKSRQADFEGAFACMDGAETLMRKHLGKTTLVTAIRFRGYLLKESGRLDEARERFEEALALAREVGDRRETALCLGMLCSVGLRTARFAEVEEHLGESVAIARVMGDEVLARGLLDYRTSLCSLLGEFKEAVSLQGENVAFWKAKNLAYAQAIAETNFGTILLRAGDLPSALLEFKRSARTLRAIGDKNMLALLYRALGDYLRARGKYASALSRLEQVNALSGPAGGSVTEGGSRSLAALVWTLLGRGDEAEREGALAAKIIGKAADLQQDHPDLVRRAIRMRERGDLAAAALLLEKARKVLENSGERPLEIECLAELGEVARLGGAPGIAGAYLERAASLNAGVRGRLEAAAIARGEAAVLLDLGRGGEALKKAAEALSLARSSRSRAAEAPALLVAGAAECSHGDAAKGRERLEAAAAIFARARHVRGRATALLALRSRFPEDPSSPAWAAELESLLERFPCPDLRAGADLLEAGLLAAGNAGREWVGALLESALSNALRAGARRLEWEAREAAALVANDADSGDAHSAAAIEIARAMEAGIPEDGLEAFRKGLEAARGALSARFGRGPARPASPGRQPALPAGAGDSAALRAVLEAAKRLTTERRLPALLDGIVDSAISLFGAKRGFLLLEKEGLLEAEVSRNYVQEEKADLEFSQTVAREVVRTCRGLCSGNVLADGGFPQSKSVKDLSLKSVLCVPLRIGASALGALYLDDPGAEGAFQPKDLAVLQALADLAALAIEDARVHERLHRYERDLERQNLDLRQEMETQAVELGEIRGRLRAREKELRRKYAYEAIVSQSAAMEGIFGLLDRVTESDLPVLVQGETGTGKELVARAIHFNGPRSDGPFMTVNCTAITETLLESELFGYVKGAFTGAAKDEPGLFVAADGGTLLLDEVGDMDKPLQAKLLRVLQEGEVRPVGGKSAVPVDVRILCTTNRDLKSLVASGAFREDLFYRLNVVSITLPPLRDRREDIPLLAAHFLRESLERDGRRPDERRFTKGALEALAREPWAGNVRQLKNQVERMALLTGSETLSEKDVRSWLEPGAVGEAAAGEGAVDFKEGKQEFERKFVVAALRRNLGNISRAAKEAGLDRAYFYKLMRKHGIDPADYKAK